MPDIVHLVDADTSGCRQHTMSESHVRNMLLVGQDPKKAINDFSNQFVKDFVQLLKTGHGEKPVRILVRHPGR